jgi:hypothetical protein
MDRNEILHDPRHLGVPSGVSKTLSKHVVCSAQTVHLSYVKISTISKRTKLSFHMSLITLEYHRVCPKRFLSQWYVWRKPCTYLASDYNYLQTDCIELPLDPRQLGVSSGVSKMIFEPMRCLAQIMHLSCTDTYTVSRRTETRFHMIHVTLEFHRVRQK